MDREQSPAAPARTPALAPALTTAYRAALYRVFTPCGELTLRVDAYSAPLRQLLAGAGLRRAALLTAFNPASRLQPQYRNLAAHHRLLQVLAGARCRCLPACNDDPAGRWPSETAVLALGISFAAACRIATRFGQLAFLWIDATGTPRLVETATSPSP